MLLAGCGPAVTETTAAPTVTIVLTAAVGGAQGCFIAVPDPASPERKAMVGDLRSAPVPPAIREDPRFVALLSDGQGR